MRRLDRARFLAPKFPMCVVSPPPPHNSVPAPPFSMMHTGWDGHTHALVPCETGVFNAGDS